MIANVIISNCFQNNHFVKVRNYTPRQNKLRIFRFRAFKLCLPENSITPLFFLSPKSFLNFSGTP